MKNLIKMDFYRLFHTKAFSVGILAAFVVSIVTAFFNYGIVELIKISIPADPTMAETIGFIIPAARWIVGVDYADIVISGSGAFSLLISCMVAASFISTEHSSGYVKNVIGQLSDRGHTVVSKFVATSAIHLIVLLIYTFVNIVITSTFLGEYIVSYSIGNLIGALLTRLLLYFAINAVIVFLCILTKSQSLAMVIGAIFGTGVTQIVYYIASALLGILKIDFDITSYMPDGINGALSVGDINSLYGKAICVSIVFIAVFLTGSIAIIKNRDVR